MSDQIKLGTIVSLASSVRQMVSLLDGATDIGSMRKALSNVVEDRKLVLKFMLALKQARTAVNTITEAPLSFVGGLAPEEGDGQTPTESMEPRPVPSRVKRLAEDPVERRRHTGNRRTRKEEDDG